MSGAASVFNRSEVEDFLSLRWNAAQNDKPVVAPSESTASAQTQAQPQTSSKKTGWADAAKSGKQNAPTTSSSTFASNLIKAAGDKRGKGI